MSNNKGWYKQGNFGDSEAKVKEGGNNNPDRIDVIHGGSSGNTTGDGHGHLVSNDGVNASYLREPGGEVVVDDSE